MTDLSNAEQQNLEWLRSVVNGNNHTSKFKEYAQKNIQKFELRLVWNQRIKYFLH